MAILLTAASSQGYSIASSPDYNAAYTLILWVNPTTITGDPGILTISQDGFDYDQIYLSDAFSGFVVFRASVQGVGTADAIATSTPATSTWICIVARRDSVASHSLLSGTTPGGITLNQTTNFDVSGRGAANRVDIGSFRGTGQFWNGAVAAGFLYPSALTLDEIKVQAAYAQALYASPWGAWPLRTNRITTRAQDFTGNSRHLTLAGGLVSVAADPDIHGWPAETSRMGIAIT